MAIDLASKYNAKLYIVEVIDTEYLATLISGTSSLDAGKIIEELRVKVSADVRECIMLARSKGVEADGEVLEGDPATEILRYSEEIKADLIVTGSRGLSKWKRLLLGSVSNKIVSESKVSTLVVKTPT